MSRRRRQVHSVLHPTDAERARWELAARKRRYALLMVPCVLLVLFGFFCTPAPVPARLVALAVAAVLPPIAAIRGNG